MKFVYSQNLKGSCSGCGRNLSEGGFISLNSQGDFVESLCDTCKSAKEAGEKKKGKIVLKKVTGFLSSFGPNLYEIIASKNYLILDKTLNEGQIKELLDNPDVDVDIKY